MGAGMVTGWVISGSGETDLGPAVSWVVGFCARGDVCMVTRSSSLTVFGAGVVASLGTMANRVCFGVCRETSRGVRASVLCRVSAAAGDPSVMFVRLDGGLVSTVFGVTSSMVVFGCLPPSALTLGGVDRASVLPKPCVPRSVGVSIDDLVVVVSGIR